MRQTPIYQPKDFSPIPDFVDCGPHVASRRDATPPPGPRPRPWPRLRRLVAMITLRHLPGCAFNASGRSQRG